MTSSGSTLHSVLFLISSEGYFGAENMLVNLATALSNLGCRCVVGVFCDSRFQHTEVGDGAKAEGLTVELVPCAGRLDMRAVKQIRGLIAKYDVDVLHTHGYKADLYGYVSQRSSRVALVATCHNWPSRAWSMRVYASLDRLALRKFDRVVAISDPLFEILIGSGVEAGRVQMIANGVEIDRFRDAKPTLRDELALGDDALVGFVGRLVPGKGGEVLLRAAQQVLRVSPSTKFVFVGDGPSRHAWESLAKELGISDQAVFAGVRSDMPGVYSSFQLLALPSLSEAMPMCVLEAMAAGKPVVASKVGAIPKMVDPGQTGLLVDPGDIDGLSDAIIKILKDRELARQMGKNGSTRARQLFSADAMAREYEDLYRQVTDSHRDSARTALSRA
jgi:glycosyltransferase involved in cell wall biosynthesis